VVALSGSENLTRRLHPQRYCAGTCCSSARWRDDLRVVPNSGTDSDRPSNFATLDQASRADSLGLPRPIDGNRSEPQIEPRCHQQFQIIGVLNRLYVLMENSDGLVLVDHTPRTSEFCSRNCAADGKSRSAVAAHAIAADLFVAAARCGMGRRNVATLQKMGIGIENFGGQHFRVDTLPAFLEIADAAGFLRKVIDELKTTSRNSSPLRLGEDMIAKTVCRHAVKANDPLRYPEIEKLIAI